MIGTILGDIVGSTREFKPIKTTDFRWIPKGSSFTDDTILSCASLDALTNNLPFANAYKSWGKEFPNPKGGYGNRFKEWLHSDSDKPYGSKGNGAPMRISPIGWINESLEHCLELAELSCNATHNHKDSIESAQAIVEIIWRVNRGEDLKQTVQNVAEKYNFVISKNLLEIRPDIRFDVFAKPTVSAVLQVLLESNSFEASIRNAVSLGGDSDTIASIAGAIAEAAFEPNYKGVCQVLSYVPTRIATILIEAFQSESFLYHKKYNLQIINTLVGYKSSRYEIHWNDGIEDVFIDGKIRVNKTTIGIVTAFNPKSVCLTEEKNLANNALLKKDLDVLGCQYYPSLSVDPKGEWMSENGFAILGLTKQQLNELAQKYQQNAIVHLEEGMPAELVWSQ